LTESLPFPSSHGGAMDASMLQPLAAQLDAVIGGLRAAAQETPDVLVKPSLEKATETMQDLESIIAEARQGKHMQLPESDLEDLRTKAAEALGQAEVLRDLLDEEPWLDPPKLRKMRQAGEAVAQSVSGLRKIINVANRRLLLQPRREEAPAQPRREAYSAPIAAAMAGDALAENMPRPAGAAMDVDEALAMLLDKKQGGYRGGLCGIVHAAGVQEMTPFNGHSPAKFEFVFATKCSAAFNLHQLSSMI